MFPGEGEGEGEGEGGSGVVVLALVGSCEWKGMRVCSYVSGMGVLANVHVCMLVEVNVQDRTQRNAS